MNGDASLSDVVDLHFPWCSEWRKDLKELFLGYVHRKQENNVLDFDDLLLYLAKLLEDEKMADRIGGRFDHVLVDEYQDTNRLQAAILRGLRRKNSNIMVVGDDAQSIYSFRGASVENMFDFPKDFKGTTVLTLDQNYRSRSPILEVTNCLISNATQAFPKDLWSTRSGGQRPQLIACPDEASQDEYIVKRVLEHREEGIPLHRQAILIRAGHLSNSLEVELSRRGVPFRKFGGLRFIDAAHIKDLLGFLRIVENPRDEIAWFRVLQLIDRIGPASAAKIFAHVARSGYDPTSILSSQVPPPARDGIVSFARLFSHLNLQSGAPARDVELARKTYEPFLETRFENPIPRRHDLENLEQIASRYRSRSGFLVDLQLDPPSSTRDLKGSSDKDEECLVLSTIHSAKGCEWDVVYLIHAADGSLPHSKSIGSDKEIEEERRLTYVAMTRARDFLYVTWPMRYYGRRNEHTDGYGNAQLCRFFTDDVKALMDCKTEGPYRLQDKEAWFVRACGPQCSSANDVRIGSKCTSLETMRHLGSIPPAQDPRLAAQSLGSLVQ